MSLFDLDRCALIGMVHLAPLPGSPRWGGSLQPVLDAAVRDAEALLEGGVDAVLVENMGDLPYLRGAVPPWTVAAMAVATDRVAALGAPTGVQVLAAANLEALGVAVAGRARFIRVEGFAYGHLADEGWIDACAGPLLRARRSLGAEVEVWADVQKKHSAHAATADLSLLELAQGHGFCGADALIVTGAATGEATAPEDVRQVAGAGLPVLVGSGVEPTGAASLCTIADGLIVGSWLKRDGQWRNPVDVDRVRRLARVIAAGGGGEDRS